MCASWSGGTSGARSSLSRYLKVMLGYSGYFGVLFFSWISEKRRSPGMSLWRHPACQHESDSELRCCSSDSAMRKGWFTGEAAHGSSDYTIQKGNWKGKIIIFQCLLFNFIYPLWISATEYPEIKVMDTQNLILSLERVLCFLRIVRKYIIQQFSINQYNKTSILYFCMNQE